MEEIKDVTKQIKGKLINGEAYWSKNIKILVPLQAKIAKEGTAVFLIPGNLQSQELYRG